MKQKQGYALAITGDLRASDQTLLHTSIYFAVNDPNHPIREKLNRLSSEVFVEYSSRAFGVGTGNQCRARACD